jgi:uncharacterized protein
MVTASQPFQVFVKPIGARCNLDCHYCYYLKTQQLYASTASFRMSDETLEAYITQHIAASPEPVIRFSWHGGEPLSLGLDFFRTVVALQRQHLPPSRRIVNGVQTNGTLLNEEWCRFFAAEGFTVGLSVDGPPELHNRYRVTKNQQPTHARTMEGYRLLQKHGVYTDILCVVHALNVQFPLPVYRFFKQMQAPFISFLPLVERNPEAKTGVSSRSVPADAWGAFLCTIFDEWRDQDIGQVKVQVFEEAIRVAFNQDHSLCIFRPTCGDIPVVEHNGDVYACDHFVDEPHYLGNLHETPLVNLLESPSQRAFGHAKVASLPLYCRTCSVRMMCHGECPKNRFLTTPEGELGLNYLCAGYYRFFTHCQPFVDAVAAQWQHQTPS